VQDLNDIYYFVQVVELGSFTAASKALGVAKSQLSFRVARLEASLGVRLIQRTTRRSHVSEIGQRYYEQCRQLLAAAEQTQRVIDEAQAAPRGRIHVACPVLFAQLLLAPILVDFLRQHPEVQIDLDICHHQVDVIAGGYDIAFRVHDSLKDSSLVSVMGVWELTFVARTAGRAQFRHLEMLITAALIYWILSIVFELIQVRLEAYYGKGYKR